MTRGGRGVENLEFWGYGIQLVKFVTFVRPKLMSLLSYILEIKPSKIRGPPVNLRVWKIFVSILNP